MTSCYPNNRLEVVLLDKFEDLNFRYFYTTEGILTWGLKLRVRSRMSRRSSIQSMTNLQGWSMVGVGDVEDHST